MKHRLLYTLALFFATLQTFAQTYTYDKLNRLTKVVYENGVTVTYGYDALGNRTSKTVTGASGATYTITVNVSPSGSGSVTGGGTYAANSTAELRAIPNAGYKFSKWSNNKTDNPLSLTVTGNISLTAYFTESQSDLPGDVNGDHAVDVADIATIISVMAGSASSSIGKNADVNHDDIVDVADIATGISIMAGGSTTHEPHVPEGWTNAITNGNLEGEDVSSYYAKTYPSVDVVSATIVAGAGKNGSRGILVKAGDDTANEFAQSWDSQFWIKLNEAVPAGTKVHVEFDYKASKAAMVSTQCHSEPGAYLHWACIGDLNFTTNWQTFSGEFEVASEADGMLCITFNLQEEKSATDYYFDNFGVWYQKPNTTQAPAGVEAVDLGLPSGTLWANMNVGAEKPSDYGLYFAWGETTGYATASSTGRMFDWASYKWMNNGQSSWYEINKYQVADGETGGCWYSGNTFIGDGLSQLELADDAAHSNWGGEWVMPTTAEFNELLGCTTNEWTTVNGISGRKFTSKKNGKSIFLPAAGECGNETLSGQNSFGTYWSSSIDNKSYTASTLAVWENKAVQMTGVRFSGYSVRPIIRGNNTPDDGTDVVAVDLGLPSGTKWANMNIGAKNPSDIGNYYAWGETDVKSEYSWDTYMYGNSNNDVVDIGTDIASTTYDVAKKEWGGTWRMPSYTQWSDLLGNCDWEWTFLTKTQGVMLTSKINGKSIFLPTTGFFSTQSISVNTDGYYWSSTWSSTPQYGWVATFTSSKILMHDKWMPRYMGVPVRPVR